MAASKVDTIVHGGTVVTATHTFQGSVAIRGEKIVAVGPDDSLPDADNYIDASGKQVFPGPIDAHSHFDNIDPYELGIKAGALAGLTTVLPFATYDVKNKETIPQAINRLKDRLSKESCWTTRSTSSWTTPNTYWKASLKRFPWGSPPTSCL